MKIAYLAWGSLLWDYNILPIKHYWKKSEIKLPLEYSRKSDHKKGRMTLVIDKKYGSWNNVWYALVDLNNLNMAIRILRKREKSKTNKSIGYVNLIDNTFHTKTLGKLTIDKIKKWMKNKNIEAVIWTDLQSNWNFNIERGIKYLQSRPLKTQIKILEYIIKSRKKGDIKTKFSKYLFKNIEKLIN